MFFSNEKRRVPLRLLAGMAIALLLAGCAGTSSTAARQQAAQPHAADPVQTVVVGQGSDDVRDVIRDTNQKMFDAEHAGSPDAASANPSQPQNGNSQ